jgi:alkaline phosphatase
VAFSDAVQKAVDLTSVQDTLIVTTADHSHTLSLVGYPGHGNDIFGKVCLLCALVWNQNLVGV